MDEDTVSLPHQQSFSSLKTDSDYIYQVHTPSIHMPLYETLASKPSVTQQKSSLYSLASRRVPKTASTSRSSSQLTLYGKSPDAKTLLNLRRNAQKSTPDLGKHPTSESENFIEAQKSTPDLSFNRPGWNAETSSTSKYPTGAAAGCITNLIVSPSTASNFIYKPDDNDSSANLFSESGKTSSNNIANFQDPSTSGLSTLSITKMHSEIGRAPAPLESSLENILNSDTRVEIGDRRVSSVERNPSMKNFIELSSAQVGYAGNAVDSNPSVSVETRIGSASSTHDNPRFSPEIKQSAINRESGGLGDYLQSLKSSRYQASTKRQYTGRGDDPQIPWSPE